MPVISNVEIAGIDGNQPYEDSALKSDSTVNASGFNSSRFIFGFLVESLFTVSCPKAIIELHNKQIIYI